MRGKCIRSPGVRHSDGREASAIIAPTFQGNSHGFSRRQARPRHRPSLQPFDRLRHRQGRAARRRGARLHLPERALPGARSRDGRRARQQARVPLRCRERRGNRGIILRAEKNWDGLDGLVHAIAFAPREAIAGDFLDGVSREAFHVAHDVSSYSFAALAKSALPMMHGRKGALVTLTYLGADRVVPNYNIMGLAKASLEASVRYLAASLGPRGIRVNGVSAGPIKTLAASGISGFGKILKHVEENAPLRRNVTTEDIGNVAAFLLSDLAAGVTGEIVYVDGGFNTVVGGMAVSENSAQ